MNYKVKLFALLLSICMGLLCGCANETASSKPAVSLEASGVSTSSNQGESTSVASKNNNETSKVVTPSSSNTPTATSNTPVSTSSAPTLTSSSEPSLNNTDKTINKFGNSQGNLNGGAWAAGQGDWIYYSTFEALYKMKSDGSQNKKIFDDFVSKINVVGDWLYFNRNGNDISRMKTDGSQYKVILKNVSDFAVVNHKLYYTDSENGYLYRIDEDGRNKTLLINQDCRHELNVTNDVIYWEGSDGVLYMSDINGKNIKSFIDFFPQGLIVDGNVMYESGNLKVSNAKTGEEIKQFFRKRGGAGNINISNGWIYFTYWEDEDCIYRIKTDGSQLQKLNDISATSIMVVGEWLFYVKMNYEQNSDGTISGRSSDRYRMRIDGSNNQIISKWL